MAQAPDVPFYSLVPALFVSRPNRFAVVARIGAKRVQAACRDPGRLRELLVPGARVLLEGAPKTPRRRTSFTLTLVRHRGRWVSAVPALANRILDAALRRRGAPGLVGGHVVRREVPHGRSRIDFVLEVRGRPVLTEVKSVTLVEGGCALFPDAPTERGRRHLRELAAHCRRGGRALVVFVVQRDDALSVSPHPVNDPAFAGAAAEAASAGVRFLAYACRVTPAGILLERRIPFRLPERTRD